VREKAYLCIDLKSFYASVECVERELDPMTTRLVVADPDRSDKTICLAVSPALRALGVKNRCRVFEIPKGIQYLMAPPRMQKYIDYAAEIYGIYLRHIAPEDIHVYSIDEAFLDVTPYLAPYGKTPRAMAQFLMGEVLRETGIRATCGIGTNLYLAKVALDIQAKHAPDFIAELTEARYRETLWEHRPITDFWRVGAGTARRLAHMGVDTMGGVAQLPEDVLYHAFGVDAELLYDHAWGREPTTIAHIKAYRPKNHGLSSGQVLMRDYAHEEAALIVREMMDQMSLELVDKGLMATSLGLYVGYANRTQTPPDGGSVTLDNPMQNDRDLIHAASALYERITDPEADVRRITLSCSTVPVSQAVQQLSLFDAPPEEDERALRIRQAVVDLKKRFGKNAVLKGMDLEDAATARDRNRQIGGHKSGE